MKNINNSKKIISHIFPRFILREWFKFWIEKQKSKGETTSFWNINIFEDNYQLIKKDISSNEDEIELCLNKSFCTMSSSNSIKECEKEWNKNYEKPFCDKIYKPALNICKKRKVLDETWSPDIKEIKKNYKWI